MSGFEEAEDFLDAACDVVPCREPSVTMDASAILLGRSP